MLQGENHSKISSGIIRTLNEIFLRNPKKFQKSMYSCTLVLCECFATIMIFVQKKSIGCLNKFILLITLKSTESENKLVKKIIDYEL